VAGAHVRDAAHPRRVGGVREGQVLPEGALAYDAFKGFELIRL
jgi:hypothetical protein